MKRLNPWRWLVYRLECGRLAAEPGSRGPEECARVALEHAGLPPVRPPGVMARCSPRRWLAYWQEFGRLCEEYEHDSGRPAGWHSGDCAALARIRAGLPPLRAKRRSRLSGGGSGPAR